MRGTKEDTDRTYLIADLPTHERPRERLLQRGSDSLRDVELLAIVLRSGRQGTSALDLAQQLVERFDGLGGLAKASPTELAQVKGIGPAKAAELKATFALARRLAATSEPERPVINSPALAADYWREIFRGKAQEELRCLLLDTRSRVIRETLVTIGLVDRSQAHAREVFRAAIQHNAAKVLIAHNHPSGDPTPSANDRKMTDDLVQAGKIVGLELVDHLVLGARTTAREKDYVSFREAGLL